MSYPDEEVESTLPSELARLRQNRRELRQHIAEMQASYDVASEEAGVQAAGIRAAADSAASAMRAAFGAASTAYAAKEGAAAAGFAAEGRASQEQAQALNAQANAVLSGLSARRSAISQARTELNQLNAQIRQAQATEESERRASKLRANPAIRHIAFGGFQDARGIDAMWARAVLAELPPRLTREIGSVHYIDALNDRGAIGLTSTNPGTSVRARIRLYLTYEYDLVKLERRYRETLVHEGAHVLFDRLMTSGQRLAWGEIFEHILREDGFFVSNYARNSKREDFSESFMFYRLHQEELYTDFRERYDFIDAIYKEVSK